LSSFPETVSHSVADEVSASTTKLESLQALATRPHPKPGHFGSHSQAMVLFDIIIFFCYVRLSLSTDFSSLEV
jgi:hypothetical protein